MFVYNRDLENRDLINPENGLMPESTGHPVNLEANPFQKYIEGRDVVQDYHLPNNENERNLLSSIADRLDPTKILDASNIDSSRVDEDIMQQMVYEDRGDTSANYMGLEASDFIQGNRKAIKNFRKFEYLTQPKPDPVKVAPSPSQPNEVPVEMREYANRLEHYRQPIDNLIIEVD